jgi:hypothetical protein
MKIAKAALASSSLLVCGLFAASLQAQDSPSYHPFTIGPEIGTTGYGGTATWRFLDHFGVTGGFDYFHYAYDNTIESVSYDARLRLQSEPVGLALYPSADSSFHVNLGIVFNQNKLTGVNQNGTFTLNGNTYNGTLNLDIQQQPISPYVSMAGNFFYFDKGHHVSLGGELGCMYTGTPRVGLTSSNPAANNDVATERELVIKYANDFKFWPIAKLGLNISF